MTKENRSSGNLWDSTKLTLHQDLEMREIQLALYEIDKETMMELYLRLQEQVFKLNNLIAPLLHEAKKRRYLIITREGT